MTNESDNSPVNDDAQEQTSAQESAPEQAPSEETTQSSETETAADDTPSSDAEVTDASSTKYVVSVHYGMMGVTENFITDLGNLLPGDTVIMRTQRGVDYGQVVKLPVLLERDVKGLGTVLRVAGDADLNIIKHIHEVKEPEELAHCQKRIQGRKLPMKLAGVEHLFSGDKVIFYFLADGRVDFRELVKDLARNYRTRIEMRQIGVRDEARMLADYEHCGRELCCRTFLRNLEPVTMRMAKMQKTTLDPTKISGHCGRLMCCLRFEDAVYNDLRSELPPKGEVVVTPQFEAEVLSADIIKQMLTVRLEDGSRESIHVSEIVERKGKKRRQGGGDTRQNDRRKGGGRSDNKGGERSGRDDKNAKRRDRDDQSKKDEKQNDAQQTPPKQNADGKNDGEE